MNEKIVRLIEESELQIKDERERLVTDIKFPLEEDYVDFLNKYDGAVGMLYSEYIDLYSVGEIMEFNTEDMLDEMFSKYLVIASMDDEAIVIDKNSNHYIVSFIELCEKECIKIADNFEDFICKMSSGMNWGKIFNGENEMKE